MPNRDKIPSELTIVCVFCNAPWTSEMEVEAWDIGGGCDTCDYGRVTEYSVKVRCSNCHKIVYVKEGTD